MKKLIFGSILMLFVLSIYQCASNNEDKALSISEIKPPLESANVGFEEYKIDASKAQTIQIPSGSSIEKPENAFVDEDGKDVKEVTLKYREMVSPGEIILSGIPMQYDSAGTRFQFKTGGMFELNGFTAAPKGDGTKLGFVGSQSTNIAKCCVIFVKNMLVSYIRTFNLPMSLQSGSFAFYNNYLAQNIAKDEKAVNIKKGKAVTVNFNSPYDGNYNLYFWDKVKGWIFSTPSTAIKTRKDTANKEVKDKSQAKNGTKIVQTTPPVKPVKYSVNNDKVLDIQADYSRFPELMDYANIIWKHVGNESDGYIDSTLKMNWKSIVIDSFDVKNNKYKVTFTRNKISRKITVSPVLDGKSFKKAEEIYNQQLLAYKEYLNERKQASNKKDEKKAAMDMLNNFKNNTKAKDDDLTKNFTIRTLPIYNFGIYNCDTPLASIIRYAKQLEGLVALNLKATIKNESKNLPLYHVAGDGNVITRYESNNLGQFKYDPDEFNAIVVIMPDSTAAIFTDKDFRRLNFKPITAKDAESVSDGLGKLRKECTIQLKQTNEKIRDSKKLDELVSGL